jgi:phytoene synthase
VNDRQSSIEHCQDIVRNHDKDRYLASLFAPDAVRPHLWALYAFNYEVARIREVTSEPQLGEIRLQWWHDAIAGITKGQGADGPVFLLLKDAIEAGGLPRPALFNLLEARRFDLYNDPMPSLAALEGYLGETSSALIQLSAMVLVGASAADTATAAGYAGVAYGIAGLLRAIPLHRARGQCYVPVDLLQKHGATPADVSSGGNVACTGAALAELRDHARQRLAEARQFASDLPPGALPAFLPASLVDLYLARLSRPGADPLNDTADILQLGRQWRMWWRASRGHF